jgi:DNA polymerase
MRLWVDTEVYSAADLKSVGVYRYAADRSTSLLLVAWAVDDAPAQVWDCLAEPLPPPALARAVEVAGEIWAHNAQFDRVILSRLWQPPPDRWRCTMVQAMEHGLPASLAALGATLGLTDGKLSEGKELVRLFCLPGPAGRTYPSHCPAEWTRFVEYCLRDVEAARECQRRMPAWNYPDTIEQTIYTIDQVINDRGLPMDRGLAAAAAALTRRATDALDRQMHELTSGEVQACTQVQALRGWLVRRGVSTDSLDKAALEDLLGRDLDDDVREALLLRQAANKTSTAKFGAILGALGDDDRLRGSLMFCGASRTGRWSGKLFQPQNLPRTAGTDQGLAVEAVQSGMADTLYASPLEAAAAAIRGTIRAPRGRKLVCADLSAIEGRVLAWLAGEQWKLDAYATGEDLYKLAYSRAFGTPKWEVTKEQRQVGKVLELALGYQGGVGALQTMAAGYGLTLPDRETQREWVGAWRAANLEIEGFWYALEDAAKAAIRKPGKSFGAGRIRVAVRRQGDQFWLLLKLPSGRFLAYHRPRIEYVVRTHVDPETGDEYTVRREQVTFAEYGQGRNLRVDTYGGKLVENATQAVARDVLAHNLPGIEDEGFRIIGTVHDEVITEVELSEWCAVCEEDIHGELSTLLARQPPWAEGLPLAAEGFVAERYRK